MCNMIVDIYSVCVPAMKVSVSSVEDTSVNSIHGRVFASDFSYF